MQMHKMTIKRNTCGKKSLKSLLDLIEKDPETKGILKQTVGYLKESVGIDSH